MKKLLIAACGIFSLGLPIVSFGAGVNLLNGGFGQAVNDPQNFGVAVCNSGAEILADAVPLSVTVGEHTILTSSVNNLAPSKCEYTYLPYAQAGMETGQTYSVTVTIDSNHTIISSTDNQTTYSITVPGAPVARVAGNDSGTANASAQFGNFFSMLTNWFGGFFK